MAVSKWSNCRNEELLQMIRNLSEKLGRTPCHKDMGTKNNMPSANLVFKKFNTRSWNQIIKLAELKANRETDKINDNNKKKNMYCDGLIALYNKLGRIPTSKEISEDKNCPYVDWIFDNYDGISNFYYQMNIIEHELTIENRIKISIDELIKLANKLQRCPKAIEFDQIEHDGLKRRALENNLNMKYNDICKKYISDYHVNNDKNIPTENIVESIKTMYEQYGYILPYNEYKKLKYSYSYSIIYGRFNKTYGELVGSLGYKMHGTTTKQKDEEEMLDDFLKLFKKLHRIPLAEEFTYENNVSSYRTYIKKFKSIKNVCDILQIDWDLYNLRYGGGRILFDKNNEMCRSLPELEITNFLIDNKIKYEKEVLYTTILESENNRKTSRRLDWVIECNNNKYYVEYFGMYTSQNNSKIIQRYIKKARKKIKDLYKAGLINNCIFIFPDDLKRNKNDDSMNWLEEKLKSFFMQKFNINLEKVA